jgi:hypothetical protein
VCCNIAKQLFLFRAVALSKGGLMEDAKTTNQDTTQVESDRKLDRRQIGKFLAYTAPALVALATAKAGTY